MEIKSIQEKFKSLFETQGELYSSPGRIEVELNPGFECQLGGSFEIINEGCISNCP